MKKRRRKAPTILPKDYMVEHFSIEILNKVFIDHTWANEAAVKTFFARRAIGESRRWIPVEIVIDEAHGLRWFSLFCIGKPEFIGFQINHNRRSDPDERGKAYDRLVPPHQYRPHRPRHRPVPDWMQAGRREGPQRPRKGRQRVGRSYRRF